MSLDTNYDGAIEVEDILRHFKPEDKIDYYDLKKLMEDKDSNGHKGRIGYSDFSRWLGGCIHQVAGFYFRHDSIRNPEFDAAEKLHQKKFSSKEKEALIASNLGSNIEL